MAAQVALESLEQKLNSIRVSQEEGVGEVDPSSWLQGSVGGTPASSVAPGTRDDSPASSLPNMDRCVLFWVLWMFEKIGPTDVANRKTHTVLPLNADIADRKTHTVLPLNAPPTVLLATAPRPSPPPQQVSCRAPLGTLPPLCCAA